MTHPATPLITCCGFPAPIDDDMVPLVRALWARGVHTCNGCCQGDPGGKAYGRAYIAFPDIALSFPESSIGALSWILNAYNVVFAAFLLPFGRLADVFGRKRVFLAGLAVFVLGSALCATAWSVDVLVVFRVVQALGAAAMVPAGLALVLHGFEVEQRSHAVALISAIGALAAGLGPAIGGLLIAVADWRLVFVINLPIGAAAYVLASRRLVESRVAGQRRLPDMPGAAIFALAIADRKSVV